MTLQEKIIAELGLNQVLTLKKKFAYQLIFLKII